MDETQEKQLAKELGDLMDAGAAPRAGSPGPLIEAFEAARILCVADANAPEIDPGFDARLRDRLVSDTKVRRYRSPVIPLGVAAVFLYIFLVPFLVMLRHQKQENRMALLEKYDKIYVTSVAMTHRTDYLEKHLESLRQDRDVRIREMQFRMRMDRLRKYREQITDKKEPT